MEQNEIIEGNRLIDEFVDSYKSGTLSDDVYLNGFKYHTSWDWLMPVIEKIGTIFILNKYCVSWSLESEIGLIITVHFHQPDPLKQRKVKQFINKIPYCTVVEFIKWDNLSNK